MCVCCVCWCVYVCSELERGRRSDQYSRRREGFGECSGGSAREARSFEQHAPRKHTHTASTHLTRCRYFFTPSCLILTFVRARLWLEKMAQRWQTRKKKKQSEGKRVIRKSNTRRSIGSEREKKKEGREQIQSSGRSVRD